MICNQILKYSLLICVQENLFDMKTIHLNSSFKKTHSVSMNSEGFNLHITGQKLAMAESPEVPHIMWATHHGGFLRSMDHKYSKYLHSLANHEYLLSGNRNIYTFGKQLFKQVHLSGKDLPALDFLCQELCCGFHTKNSTLATPEALQFPDILPAKVFY